MRAFFENGASVFGVPWWVSATAARHERAKQKTRKTQFGTARQAGRENGFHIGTRFARVSLVIRLGPCAALANDDLIRTQVSQNIARLFVQKVKVKIAV